MLYQKKSLGQNFLRSRKILDDIVRAGNVLPGEIVLEAGPGEGTLTQALLTAGAKVIAVEKDRRLIHILQQKFSAEIASGQLTLAEGDILEFSIFPPAPRIAGRAGNFQFSKYKVIANIPYYITGAFIRKFLTAESQPSEVIILVQKEVAERIVAKDGKESLLSISVKTYGTPRYVQTVKAGSFSPPPKVDSAILAIENISKNNFFKVRPWNPSRSNLEEAEKRFFEIVKAGFSHKRKIIAGNLKSVFGGQTEEKIANCKIAPASRAETMTLENWLCLSTDL